MPNTPVYSLPYPPPTGVAPDVPYYMQQLAEAVDEQFQDHALQLGSLPSRLHLQVIGVGTTDASGYRTLSHDAPFTPDAIFIMMTGPSAYFGVPWGVDTITATTFRVRFMTAAGDGALVSGNSGGFVALLVGA